MKVDLQPNEVVLKAGNTNHQISHKVVKGKLILTNQRIYFKALEDLDQIFDFDILPHEIKEVHYFNTGLIIPNGLNILTKEGDELKFVIKNRNDWGIMINKMY